MTDSKKAVLYMFLSIIAFSTLNYIVKTIASQLNSYQILFFRSFPMLIISFYLIIKSKENIFKKKKKLLVLRSIVGLISLILFYEAIKFLDVGIAVSLRYVSPIFAIFMAVVILKNELKPINIFTSVFAIISLFIISGFANNINLMGVLLAIFSALLLSVSWVLVSKIGSNISPIVIVFYFAFFSTFAGLFLSIYSWNPIDLILLPKLIALGMLGYIAQLYLTKAFQLGDPKKIAPFQYFEILITMIFGFLFINESYSFLTVFGALLLIFSLMITFLDVDDSGTIDIHDFTLIKSKLDKNKDGKLDHKDLLIMLDKNKDGKLDYKDLIMIIKNRINFILKIFSNLIK